MSQPYQAQCHRCGKPKQPAGQWPTMALTSYCRCGANYAMHHNPHPPLPTPSQDI